GYFIINQDHVGLGLGEAGAVALVGSAGQAVALFADDPAELVLALLLAHGAVQGVGGGGFGFGEKIALFHFQFLTFSGVPGPAPSAAAADACFMEISMYPE